MPLVLFQRNYHPLPRSQVQSQAGLPIDLSALVAAAVLLVAALQLPLDLLMESAAQGA